MVWPSESPPLNTIEFYLWAFLATKVFDRRPQSIIGIKEAVRYFANSIEPETVAEVSKSFRKRVKLCYEMLVRNFSKIFRLFKIYPHSLYLLLEFG